MLEHNFSPQKNSVQNRKFSKSSQAVIKVQFLSIVNLGKWSQCYASKNLLSKFIFAALINKAYVTDWGQHCKQFCNGMEFLAWVQKLLFRDFVRRLVKSHSCNEFENNQCYFVCRILILRPAASTNPIHLTHYMTGMC